MSLRGPRSPKIILDISQTQSVAITDLTHANSVKMEPCDYCGRLKGSCLCCRNFVKVMSEPYYERSPNSDTLPPLNHHYSSPQANLMPDGSLISPGSNNSFISIEELNRKRRLSVSDYEYEDANGLYVNPPSDCLYEAKRARYEDVNMIPPAEMDHESYRKFYSSQYNGHFYQTEPPLTLKPFSGSTETVISIGSGSHSGPLSTNCQMQMQSNILPQSGQHQPLHHQPPVEGELPPIFSMCSNESAQTRSHPYSQTADDHLDIEDDYDDSKSVDSRLASESETSSHIPKTRGRPRTGRVSKASKKKKQKEQEEASFEDMQQMRVMANVRERQRTQVIKCEGVL